MKPLNRIIALSLLTVTTGFFASAQSDPAKYNERAAAVREEVWAWKVPAFNNRNVPAGYANESCVILARRTEIEADTKKRMSWALQLHRNFYYNSTVRELVRINDKVSLEEYSSLSYRQFKKLNSWMSPTTSMFVGARIIKPNGSMKEVNVDEAVTVQGTKNDQQRKLAISDLQVGDILDYFVRVEEFSTDYKEPERMLFVFGDDHPILDYSIHCDIGAKYSVQYRSMNKAPEVRQTSNDDKDCILDLSMQNLAAVPTGLWMASIRELPAFRIHVSQGGGRNGVVKDVPLTDIIGEINSILSMYNPMTRTAYVRQVDNILEDYDRNYKKLPQDSLANLIYYAYRFIRYYNRTDNALEVGQDRNEMDINSFEYLTYLQYVLSKHRIPSQLVLMPYKHGPAVNQVMSPGDLSIMLRIDLDKPVFFSNENMFTCPGYVPTSLEGQPCPEMHPKNFNHGQPVGLDKLTPLSTAADNCHREDLHIAFQGADMQLLRLKRYTVLTGKSKETEQLRLLNFEDCYESERTALHVEKSIMDDLKKARRSRNLSEDYATALQKARESLKDRFRSEISSEYEQEPKELIAYKVDNPGLRHVAPDLAYTTEFTMDGLVQRAGNNFLLNIGRTLPSPLRLTPSQRTRSVAVYMSSARTLDYTVTFDIPQGYTAQGADKLNKTLENDCGAVVSSAQVQGSKLIVHFKRIYNHDQETAAKWPQMLAIIDASTDFAAQKVLLKKG